MNSLYPLQKTIITSLLFLITFISNGQGCIDFSKIDSSISDGILYPAGSSIALQGDIELKKGGHGNFWVTDSTVGFVGWLDIDVSRQKCITKKLSIPKGGATFMAIDGDTIALSGFLVLPVGPYTFNVSSGIITISGDFNVVSIGESTNTVNSICLDTASCGSVSVNKLFGVSVITGFPNPAKEVFTVDLGQSSSNIQIIDMTGKMVGSFSGFSGVQSFNTSSFEAGIYFLRIEQDGLWSTLKLFKE